MKREGIRMIPEIKYDKAYFQPAVDYILEKLGGKPDVALVLGSALGGLSEQITEQVIIDYKEIPGFLESTVKSHAGKLICGKLSGKRVVCMSGRFHYYEGYDFEDLVVPVRLMKQLGVDALILTNAAGGIDIAYKPGDIMLIVDHIKLFGASPMRGRNVEEFGSRFFDVTDMYSKSLRTVARDAAAHIGLDLKEGVYFYASGPQFETPAEIRAMRMLGGDAVGMSTVTEALTAAHCGLPVLGLSLISNMAAGVLDQPVDGEEVDLVGKRTAKTFQTFVAEILKRL